MHAYPLYILLEMLLNLLHYTESYFPCFYLHDRHSQGLFRNIMVRKQNKIGGLHVHMHLLPYSSKDGIENAGKANPNVMVVH